MTDAKPDLLHYLRRAREALLWKLDGLSEYDVHRPLTATGTNLLGLVKHVASVEAGYLGDCFGRPSPEEFPWFADDAEDNADMWATADESREDIIGLYHRVGAHSEATLAALEIDSPGHVEWWGDKGDVTLNLIVVHLIAEINRHAGQADILRELMDGSVGMRADNDNMAPGDKAWWGSYCARLEAVAETFNGPR